MSFSRTLPISIQSVKCRKRNLLSVFNNVTNSDKVQLNREFFSNSNFQSPLIEIRRYRYSFVYTRKPFSVVNSRLSSLNSNGNVGAIHMNDTPLTKSQADDLVLRLTEGDRKALLTALQEYDSNQIKAEYEAEKVPVPNSQQLLKVAVYNAVPFIGFGFLDNFVMIVAGDYIDESLGSIITISTMAAAALGNTISDVLGIGSAWYVELAASKIGLKPPNLSPIQLDMKPARRAANLGRALGITVGCLLGMIPLLFMENKDKDDKEKEKEKEKSETTKK